MRTEPIDILLKYPDRGLYGIQVIVSLNCEEEATNYCANMRFHCLLVKSEEEAKAAFKDVFDCPYVFVYVKDTDYEESFYNWMYDYLEQNNGYKEVYIVPTTLANKVFSSVAKEVDFCNPLTASTEMPKDGYDGLMDILDELYGEAACAKEPEEEVLEVWGNGGAWLSGEPVGMLFAIKKVCYGKKDAPKNMLYLNIIDDKKYCPGVKLGEHDAISPSGYFHENTANIFYDMSQIEPGTVGIVRYTTDNNKKAYYVMRPWQELTVYTERGSSYTRMTTGTPPEECDIVMTRTAFPLNNAIGILFARIGASDARWNADVVAELCYNDCSLPITYKRDNNGNTSLTVGEFSIDDNNYFKYGTKQE